MARPTFQIDKQRLRALRDEKGFTQSRLSAEVSKLLGTAGTRSEETHYQRIERTGKTSRKMANALATVLGVSAELLQGLERPEPVDCRQSITTLLNRQIENKENIVLQHALARIAEEGTDDALPWLVEEICERIEAVQLGRNPSEIAELIALTGLPEKELLKSADVLGHWFVAVTSRGCKRSDIVQGATDACCHIKEIIGDRLDHFGSDNSIRLWRDDDWFRIEIIRPRCDLMRIDFVRCRADAKGLRWSAPSWQDEFWIKELLSEWAYSAANFVTDLEGKQSPCDLQQLRMLVTEHKGHYDKSLRQMVISGHLDEIPDSTKEGFQRGRQIHSLFVSCLVADLRQALMPYLAEYPAQCWRIASSACIDIFLTPPTHSFNAIRGVRYRIGLIEEVAPNEFVQTPWRQKDKEALRQEIEGWLHAPCELAVEEDSMPRFEPI